MANSVQFSFIAPKSQTTTISAESGRRCSAYFVFFQELLECEREVLVALDDDVFDGGVDVVGDRGLLRHNGILSEKRKSASGGDSAQEKMFSLAQASDTVK